MATKVKTGVIDAGAITSALITDASITADDLHTTLDLTGKTVTVATASASDNDTSVASTAYVTTAIANLADSAPSTLNTLNELAAALGDDANYATTTTNAIATKLPLAGGTLTGSLTIPDKIVHAGDTNTYLEFNGADQFRVATGGVERVAFYNTETHFNDGGTNVDFIVETSGNPSMLVIDGGTNHIGIGKNNPVTPLDIAFPLLTSATQKNELVLESRANGSTAQTGALTGITFNNRTNLYVAGSFNSTAGIYGVQLDTAIYGRSLGLDFYTSAIDGTATSKLRIDGAGNVGIGDTVPDYRLHVNSGATNIVAKFESTDGTAGIMLLDNAGNVELSASGSTFQVQPAGGAAAFKVHSTGYTEFTGASQVRLTLGSQGTAGTNTSNWVRGNGTSFGYNSAGGDHVWEVGGAEKMRLKANGNVGIGTNNPLQPLHVKGTRPLRLERAGVASYEISIDNVVSGDSSDFVIEPLDPSSGFQVRARNASNTLIEALNVNKDGNVGIGTDAPASLLDVGGGVIADPTIRIDSAAGGDPSLVFDTGGANRSATIKFHDNGSSAAGFINYVHNGDKMNFGAGSTTGITMTLSDGIVTMPSQPGFFARGNTSQWLQGSNGWNKLIGGIAHGNGAEIGVNLTEANKSALNGYDSGSDFNITNGRFTAPVDGKYHIHGSVYCMKNGTNANDYMHFLPYVNGQQINEMYTIGGHGSAFASDFSLNISSILYLEASDYVEWKIYVAGGTNMRIYGDHLCIGAHLLS